MKELLRSSRCSEVLSKGKEFYPATCIASLPEMRGTRAWIVVPRLGCDAIENVPFTSFSRSSMLIRPIPRLSFAASQSKPRPESLTVR